MAKGSHTAARRHARLALCMAGALPGSALAQQASDPPGAQASEGEIIVTAQRREERLLDVPISVSVVSAGDLASAGATTSRDLNVTVPGLLVASNGVYIQPTVRGIGSNLNSISSEAAVALYIDGVYSPNTATNIFDLANVQQIEVLKGPQGTLFGRNATGGAILVTTRDPSSVPTLKLSLGYGSFNEIRASAYAAGPLSDTVAADISLTHRSDDGYTRDVLIDAKLSSYNESAARAKIRFAPSQDFSFTLAGDYAVVRDLTGTTVKALNRNSQFVATAVIPDDPRETALSFYPESNVESWGLSGTLQYDFGGARLKSLTAYRDVDQYALTDTDRTNIASGRSEIWVRQKTFSQEVTLASDGAGPFSWLVGAFYFWDKGSTPRFLLNNAPFIVARIETKAWAGFAEATFDVTDQLSIIGGVRYSHERKDFDAVRSTGLTADDNRSWGAWTPRASIRFKPSSATTLYASYSEGFKSGAYNATVVPQTPVNPEYVKAYEVGFKFAQGRNFLNAAAFHYDYSDLQVTIYQPGAAILRNAAQARIRGFEVEGGVSVADRLNLRAGLAYTDARYSRFPSAVVFIPRPTGGNTQVEGDASGNRLMRSPEFTANATASYSVPAGDGSVTLSGTAAYNSGFFWNVANRLKQPAYTLFNASIAWKIDDSPLTLTVWGRNLSDEVYGVFAVDTAAADAISYGRPRTVGFSLGLAL